MKYIPVVPCKAKFWLTIHKWYCPSVPYSYCIDVLGTIASVHLHRLNVLQTKIIRIIWGVRTRTHTEPIYTALHILKLTKLQTTLFHCLCINSGIICCHLCLRIYLFFVVILVKLCACMVCRFALYNFGNKCLFRDYQIRQSHKCLIFIMGIPILR